MQGKNFRLISVCGGIYTVFISTCMSRIQSYCLHCHWHHSEQHSRYMKTHALHTGLGYTEVENSQAHLEVSVWLQNPPCLSTSLPGNCCQIMQVSPTPVRLHSWVCLFPQCKFSQQTLHTMKTPHEKCHSFWTLSTKLKLSGIFSMSKQNRKFGLSKYGRKGNKNCGSLCPIWQLFLKLKSSFRHCRINNYQASWSWQSKDVIKAASKYCGSHFPPRKNNHQQYAD